MTPPPPPVPPPRQPDPSTPKPVSESASLPPAEEEKPWGPIRLRFRGKYLPPELASLVFLAALASVFLLAVLIKRSITDSSPAPVNDSTNLSSAATASPNLPQANLEPSAHRDPKRVQGTSSPIPPIDPQKIKPAPTPIAHPLTPLPSPPTPVHAPPVVSSFISTAASIDPGGSTTLSWKIGGEVEKVIISPDPGQVAPTGQVVVHPDRSTQYILTATGPGGSTTDQLLVRIASPPIPSADFSADTTQVKLGQTATLRWSVSGADQVSIDPGIGPVNPSGTTKIKPLSTIRYTLQARGPGGSSTRTVVVQVSGNAGPTSGQLVWSGTVSGTQLVTIDHDRADIGTLTGELPGLPCILQPLNERKVSIASTPSPANNFDRLVLRVTGKGLVTISIRWSLL